MEYRGVLLIGAVLGAAALGLSSGCSAPDPGAISFAERPGAAGEPQGPSTGGSTSGGTSGATSSGTSGAPVGGGDTIFGATPFSYSAPLKTANVASQTHPNSNVEGVNCMVAGCHLDGPFPWLFAGTVYTAATGGVTVPKAQIRVVKADGSEVGTAYTDANGNFWIPGAVGVTIPAGSFVGVRKEGGATMKMTTALAATDGGCNAAGACHGGTQGKVYAP